MKLLHERLMFMYMGNMYMGNKCIIWYMDETEL